MRRAYGVPAGLVTRSRQRDRFCHLCWPGGATPRSPPVAQGPLLRRAAFALPVAAATHRSRARKCLVATLEWTRRGAAWAVTVVEEISVAGNPVVLDVLQTVVSALGGQSGRAALDIVDAGGGTGGFAVPLASLGHHVTVVDPSPDSLAAAQRRAAEQNVPLRAVQGDAADLALVTGKQSADLVLCHSVLEYVDSPPAAMAAIAAVLRPGGAVSVLTASAVAAVIHRALAGRSDEAHRLLTGIGEAAGNGSGPA